VAAGLTVHARVSAGPAGVTGRPPVVLLHGLGVSGRYMLPTAAVLGSRFAVAVPDLPGFGRSEKPPRTLDTAQLAACLREWTAVKELERPIVLANSYGCQVALEASSQDPDWCCALVLVGPTVDPAARSRHAQIGRWVRNLPREPLAEGPVVLRDYLAAGARRLTRTLNDALADRPEDKLGAIELPVLVVRGERDPIVPHRWAARITALLPDARLLTIPGAAHTPNFSHPRELAAGLYALAAHLDTNRRPDDPPI